MHRNPATVIYSCVHPEQLNAAARFAQLWLRKHGLEEKGATAKVLHVALTVQAARLMVPSTGATNVAPIRPRTPG